MLNQILGTRRYAKLLNVIEKIPRRIGIPADCPPCGKVLSNQLGANNTEAGLVSVYDPSRSALKSLPTTRRGRRNRPYMLFLEPLAPNLSSETGVMAMVLGGWVDDD